MCIHVALIKPATIYRRDKFSKLKSQLDRNLEVLQLQLNESHKFLSTQLKEENSLNYAKLESKPSVYKIVDTVLPMTKLEKLRVTIEYLSLSNLVIVENNELLKALIDWVVTNNLSSKNNT